MLSSKAFKLSGKLGKPSEAEKKRLAKLFPSSSGSKLKLPAKRSAAFDPTAECVAAPQQKKKKAAVQVIRPVSRDVILMKQIPTSVPKLNQRKDLKRELRQQTLLFTRRMSSLQVNNVIVRGFRHLKVTGVVHLECGKDLKFHIAENQEPDGTVILSRRGTLYLSQQEVHNFSALSEASLMHCCYNIKFIQYERFNVCVCVCMCMHACMQEIRSHTDHCN